MRANQLIEGRDAPLYHGVSHRYAITQLQQDYIEGHTKQRFWMKGNRYRDDHPEYEDSFWMKGISTTRSKDYAMNWADIVYVLNQDKISRNYKIIPFNWGYSNTRNRAPNPKRETEEFIVMGKVFNSMRQYIEDHNDKIDELYDQIAIADKNGDYDKARQLTATKKEMGDALDSFDTPPSLRLEPLSKYLIGIYADEIHKTLGAKNIEIITEHPKFIGYF